jgi:DNA-binding LytR/AlgR family response regulator
MGKRSDDVGIGGYEHAAARGCVLVAEDEFLIALELAQAVQAAGHDAIAPVPTALEALHHASSRANLVGAVLDVSLRDRDAFGVAAVLAARGIPFVFITGHSPGMIPQTWSSIPTFAKPCDAAVVVGELVYAIAAARV